MVFQVNHAPAFCQARIPCRDTIAWTRGVLQQLRLKVQESNVISRAKELLRDLSVCPSCLTAMGKNEVDSLLCLLASVAKSRHGVPEHPEIRRLCLAHLMSISARSNDLPTVLRIDKQVKRLEKGCRHVAQGGFALVFKTKLTDGRSVAVKRPKDEFVGGKALHREILIWSNIKDENIVPFHGICKFRGTYPSTVLPWMSAGTLCEFSTTKTLREKLTLLQQVASALVYLHNHDPPIVHQDIRGNNILIDDEGHALLADFGISRLDDKFFSSMDSVIQFGNIRWLAHELIFGHHDTVPKPLYIDRNEEETDLVDGKTYARATTYSDMWSFAMTFVELLTGKKPFSHLFHDLVACMDINNGKLPTCPNVEGLATSDLWKMVQSCWERVPDSRPSAKQIKEQLEMALLQPQPALTTFSLVSVMAQPPVALQNSVECTSSVRQYR